MGFEIIQSTTAISDLENILVYISIQLKNPTAASRLLDEYEDRMATLRQSPRFYRPANIERLARRGYHQFKFGSYIAFYLIDEKGQKVSIARIFYKKRDYANIL